MENINRFLEILNIVIGENRNITYDFFATFSRFEFSLKHSGFAKGDQKRNAMANWDKFAIEHNELFQNELKLDNKNILIEAVNYLFENPPRKLKFEKGQLKWQERNIQRRTLEELLIIVRAIRNNLFHGSKNLVIFDEPTRDSKLISSGLIVLNECLNLNNDLNLKFIEN